MYIRKSIKKIKVRSKDIKINCHDRLKVLRATEINNGAAPIIIYSSRY